MHYHVTASNGVIYETNDRERAYALAKSIKDVSVREGSLEGLRERSISWFGSNWLIGPSYITSKPVLALVA